MPRIRVVLLLSLLVLPGAILAAALPEIPHAVQPEEGLLIGGQPDEAALRQAAEAGIRYVVNLRTDDEPLDFDQQALVEELGMRYLRLPIAGGDDLTPENARAFGRILEQVGDAPALMHCASGNRVGALFALHAGLYGELDVEAAVENGRARGLTGHEATVRERLSGAVTD